MGASSTGASERVALGRRTRHRPPVHTLPLGLLAAGSLVGALVLVPLTQPAAPAQPAPPSHVVAQLAPAQPATATPTRLGAGRPAPDARARVRTGVARVVTAARAGNAVPPAAALWRWPLLVTPRVVRGFDPPAQRWLPGHRGVDLAAVPGDTVVAAGAGTIAFAGPLAGRGVVTVTHGELRTTYEPVTATVKVGDLVAAGEPIATLAAGASHCGGYPSCLHWGLRRGEVYLDPLLLLGLSHPILLPIPHTS